MTDVQMSTVNIKKPNRDTDFLFPKFYARLKKGLDAANKDGMSVAIFEGWRSPQRQDYLYSIGRTEPGKIVTQAKAWESFHQCALAADLVGFKDGKWSWDIDYNKLSRYFINEGLEWGGNFKNFKDTPHFQMTCGMPIQIAKGLVQAFGVQRVWEEIAGKVV